jgi:hypothetical protein
VGHPSGALSAYGAPEPCKGRQSLMQRTRCLFITSLIMRESNIESFSK